MKPLIGFNRHLELDWLIQSASWAANGYEEQELKSRIDNLLEPIFDSKVAREKTRNLLFGVWNPNSKSVPASFHKNACQLFLENSDLNIALHWGMIISKYPFFYYVASQIGRMAKYDNLFIYSQLELRVSENYGDTSTVKRCMQFVVRTLINIGVLANPKTGLYQLRKPLKITPPKLIAWVAEATIRANDSQSKSVEFISSDPAWFPFEINLNEETLSSSSLLDLHHQPSGAVAFI